MPAATVAVPVTVPIMMGYCAGMTVTIMVDHCRMVACVGMSAGFLGLPRRRIAIAPSGLLAVVPSWWTRMTHFMAAAVAVMIVVYVMNFRVVMIVAVSIVIAVMMLGIVAVMVSTMVFVFGESRTAETNCQS